MGLANIQHNSNASDLSQAGFKAAVNILEKWQIGQDACLAVLRMPKSTYYKYLANPEKAKLDQDQLLRVSYILNIHACLRTLFDNPENVYGFMNMPNHNYFFNGASPASLIANGSLVSLHEVAKSIDSLRGGHW